jgi:hypothetical protein
VFDTTLTAVLLVAGIVLLFTYTDDSGVPYRDGDVLGALLVVIGTAALLFRRRAAATVAVVATASTFLLKTHVGNLLTKLGVRHRVQAAVYAYESGLVQPGAL